VLLSSHLMKELEGIADRLVIIDRGRLVDDTTIAALLAADGKAPVTVRTSQRVDVMAVLASAGASVTSTDRDTIEVVGLPADRIAQIVAAHGLALYALQTTPRSLEEIYLQRTNGGRSGR
jgi:ABC-2 type transport system ATP-binding protein